MDDALKSMFAVATAIVGVAIIAVLVSKNAQTGTILTSAGTALSTAINAAVSPVTGSSSSFSGGAGLDNLSL
jgi:hypothetical protein